MDPLIKKIRLIKRKNMKLKKATLYDDACIELFTDIFELASSISPMNEIANTLIQKLKKDLETHDYNEARYDIEGWLQIAEAKSLTAIGYTFLSILQLVQKNSVTQLVDLMKHNLEQVASNQPVAYQKTLEYYVKYPLWGAIDPRTQQYELLELRSASLKEHLDDFVLLYSSLDDYRSKYCLVSILLNWIFFDFNHLNKVKEHAYVDYFDLDILQFDRNEIIVDLGAFKGDTLLNYLNTYQIPFSKYYCYEMNKENAKDIIRFIEKNNIKNIVVRDVAAGKEKGQLFFELNADSSACKINNNGKISTEVVTIDNDINEAVTFIKMDIEGAEQDALIGCKGHITNEHPKLAISVYHNNEDIWKIAKMIRGMNPAYKFYLRYNGGNLVPTEIILFAV